MPTTIGFARWIGVASYQQSILRHAIDWEITQSPPFIQQLPFYPDMFSADDDRPLHLVRVGAAVVGVDTRGFEDDAEGFTQHEAA